MNARPREYKMPPDNDSGRVVNEVASAPQSIHHGTGDVEQVVEIPVPTAEEVAASIAGITQSAGSWKGLIDAEKFKAYIRERRKAANRSSVKR